MYLGLNVSSSAHNFGCVVDGGNAMAVLLLLIISSIVIILSINYNYYIFVEL